MVKRKRIGSCSTQDDKRTEEPTTSDIPLDAGDVTLQPGRTRSQHAPRTIAGTSGITLSAAEPNPSAAEKTEIKGQSTPRSSCRVVKRLRKDVSPPPQNNAVATANKKANAPKQSTDSGKTRRPWEQWSTEDKNSFFEALCEYGKDFESIQSYIAQRSKKKGVPPHGIKNKDQVRHFYYRTWHKISKVMDIGEADVKKQTQELYGLINYAELRKKYSPSINERNGQLLTELVLNGSAMVKIKGKRVRIKTPLCRALKKLNNVEDAKDGEPAKLPQEIYVELRPRCNAAWIHVQSLAQNPRVKTKTGLQRRLSTIIEYLQQRWQPLRVKQKEQIISSLPSGVASVVNTSASERTLQLRVWPSERIRTVNFSTADATSNVDISLEGYRKNTGAEGGKCRKLKQPKSNVKLSAPQPSQELAEESPQEADAASSGAEQAACTPPGQSSESNPEDEATKSLSLLQSMLELPERPPTPVQDAAPMPTPPSPPTVPLPPISNVEDLCSSLPTTEDAERMTLGQLLGLAAGEVRGGMEDEEEDAEVDEGGEKAGGGKEEELKKEEANREEDERRMAQEEEMRERYEKGWSAKEAELLTVGELCLMMGRPKKIVLYYDFFYTESEHGERSEQTSDRAVQQFTTVLKKLFSLASAMFAEKNKQGPMSPPGRGSATGTSNCSRAVASGTPPSSKSVASRTVSRSPSTRSTQRPTLQQVQEAQVQDSAAAAAAEGAAMAQQPPSANPLQGDQHVFVVPVGTAPRSHKSLGTVQDAVQEQIDKLLPAHRRGNRMRTNRKPLVVQRPLLPRADQRQVTVVQLLPSVPTLTTVVQPQPSASPPAAAAPASIIEPISPGGNMVSLLSTGPTFDVQVPLSSASTGSVLLPVAPQVVIAPTSARIVPPASVPTESVPLSPTQPLPVTSEPQERTPLSTVVSITAAVLPVDENANCSEGPAAHASCLTVADCNQGDIVPQASLPDTSLSPPSISSLLDISLPESLPAVTSPVMADEGALLNFAAATASSATFGLQSKEEIKATTSSTLHSPAKSTLTTPPMSPFKLVPSTPDPNWLNGESSDFSLSSLLNTLDSPSKTNAPLSAPGCPAVLGSENSNLDPIARLAPDVDTQLQCLMNENSVDYVAKFADLAAQIASSNVENKSST